MSTATRSSARLGPLTLAPGVSVANAVTLFVGSMIISVVSAYLSFAQPYILNAHLGLPEAVQGTVSGNLAFFTELIIIAASGVIGAFADRRGQRYVMVGGFLAIAVSYALYPWATSVEALYLFRLPYALGAAAIGAMFVAVQADYPAERSRGAFTAVVGVLSIVGFAVLIAVFAPLPRRFAAGGFDALAAGRLAFGAVAALALAGAVLLRAGLRERVAAASSNDRLWPRLKAGFGAARSNPRIALAYAAALVGRADLAIVTIFLSLWVTLAARSAGLGAEEALVQSAKLFGIIQVAALVFTPVLGLVADRVDRVTGLCLATAVAAGGYLWTGLLPSLDGPTVLPAMALLGMGQAGVILTATALVGREAPASAVGAVSGVFSLCAAVGILLATKLGGWLFDVWRPGAPFIITGAANAVVLALGLGVLWRWPSRPDSRGPES